MPVMIRTSLWALIAASLVILFGCAGDTPAGALAGAVPLDDTHPTFVYFYTEN